MCRENSTDRESCNSSCCRIIANPVGVSKETCRVRGVAMRGWREQIRMKSPVHMGGTRTALQQSIPVASTSPQQRALGRTLSRPAPIICQPIICQQICSTQPTSRSSRNSKEGSRGSSCKGSRSSESSRRTSSSKSSSKGRSDCSKESSRGRCRSNEQHRDVSLSACWIAGVVLRQRNARVGVHGAKEEVVSQLVVWDQALELIVCAGTVVLAHALSR